MELMVVLAIIGILIALAYPSYEEHIRQSRRAEAESALFELAQYLERFYTVNGRYDQDSSGQAPTLPYTRVPTDQSATVYYQLAFADSSLTASGYTLNATPTGVMAQDPCGTLTLTHKGVKGQNVNAILAQCWRR